MKSAIADWFGDVLVEYYGFTEGGMTVVNADEWRSRPGTVGRPLGGMTVTVVDDSGATVGPRTEGTVYFTAATGRRFHYRGAADKTEQAHRGNAFTVGDIGWLDDDGFLYLCGRSTDVVVSAGVNIYPAEVEQAISDVAGVADLCAAGGPDAERGETVVLFVSLLPGADHDATLAAVSQAAQQRLAPYKRPASVIVTEEIPRDQTGKLLRRVLRDALWQHGSPFAASPPTGSLG